MSSFPLAASTPNVSSGSGTHADEQSVPVQLFDLRPQHTAISEALLAAFERVSLRGTFILGEEVSKFERSLAEALGVRHAIGVSNGSDALFLALSALGIGPSDEVITTPFTFVATGEAILRTGATPVFADVEPESLCLCPSSVISMLTPRTRAVLAVHLYGNPGAVAELADVCDRRGLFLVEDACQAFGARLKGRAVGTFGTVGCFSFFPTKPLGGMGDGGVCVTNDATIGDALVSLRSHGIRARGGAERLGGNFRLDALQAALLSEKLPYVETWRSVRAKNAKHYAEAFLGCAKLSFTSEPSDSVHHAWALSTLRVPEGRDALRTFLAHRKIESRVYYPTLLADQELFRTRCRRDGLTNAERACGEVLSIPNYFGLSAQAHARVVASVLAWTREN